MLEFLKSFTYAINGLIAVVKTERNFRFMLCCAILAISFGWVCGLELLQWAILSVAIGAVLSFELLNTAIETAIDISIKSYNELAGLAKDVAAAATFVSSLSAVAVGYVLFFSRESLRAIILNIVEYRVFWSLLIVLMITFIFTPCINKTKSKSKEYQVLSHFA